MKSADSRNYSTEKEIGTYFINNREMSTTNQNGSVSIFLAWFESSKGGRILHMKDKKYSREH